MHTRFAKIWPFGIKISGILLEKKVATSTFCIYIPSELKLLERNILNLQRWYPWNLNLIKNVEDFAAWTVFNSEEKNSRKNMQLSFSQKPKMKINRNKNMDIKFILDQAKPLRVLFWIGHAT